MAWRAQSVNPSCRRCNDDGGRAVARAIVFTALCVNGVAAACGGRTPPDLQAAAVDPGLPPGTVKRRDLACGCAIKHGGSVWCWGDIATLPERTSDPPVSSPVPIEIASLGTNLAAVGDFAFAAIAEDGTFWSRFGACYHTCQDPPAPIEVAELGKTVVDVDIANEIDTCVQTVDGSLWCWGSNRDGELGDGTQESRLAPERVSALGANVAFAVAGRIGLPMACAVTRDGVLWCWGTDLFGDWPIDPASDSLCHGVDYCILSPRAVGGIDKPVASVGIDRNFGDFICALTRDGEVWCWGMDYAGQLGGAEAGDTCHYPGHVSPCRKTPGKLPILSNDVAAISVGDGTACARKQDGSLWCWGENYYGQIGIGSSGLDSSGHYLHVAPTQVTSLGNEVANVVACDGFTCARKTDGTLWCWGHNNHGQLGDGTTQDSAVPVKVLGDWP